MGPFQFKEIALSTKKDFLTLAEHDPSILTFRRCTGDDIRRLAALANMPMKQARRAFRFELFLRTRYLTKQLDPTFEPKPELRDRAKLWLENPALRNQKKPKPVPVEVAPVVKQKPAKLTPVKGTKLLRYQFN